MSKIETLEQIQKYIAAKTSPTAITFEALARKGKKLNPLEKLWGQYILANSIVLFPARRGVGKSLLAMQIGLMISQGKSQFLQEPIEMQAACVYIDFEMSEQVLQRRAAKLVQGIPNYNRTRGDSFIFFSTRKSFVDEFETIIKIIKSEKPCLLIIDNLRNAIKNSNTNSASEMSLFVSILVSLKELFGLSILLIDHFRKHTDNVKSNSDLQSGSGAKTDLVDADFVLRHSKQDTSFRIMKRLKSRLCEESDKTKLVRLNPNTLWFELIEEDVNESDHIGIDSLTDKDEVKDKSKDLYSQGKTIEEIAKILGKGKSTIHRYVSANKQH